MLNKISEWFKVDEQGHGGLADWDISRDAPYFGIEIPDAPGKYFYVWLDAPVGYLASLKNYFDSGGAKAKGEPRSFDEFMADPAVEQIHFIGKDITYFHTLFWPAMLKFSGRKVPDRVYVHGFITVSGEKMSKSRGTGISPLRYLELGMNAEWLRYYIAAKLNSHVEDIEFNPDDFVARVNSDLVGKYVNIASRAANFINKLFGGELRLRRRQRAALLDGRARRRRRRRATATTAREFGKALREAMALADRVNERVRRAQAVGAGARTTPRAAPSCRTSARERARFQHSRAALRRCCRRWPRSARGCSCAAPRLRLERRARRCRRGSAPTST